MAAGTDRPLRLAADSPFLDPDIVYLEADELVQDDEAQTLTASGQVEGRYQDRTLRADRVVYNTATGEIFAEGDVTIVDPTGAAQFAQKVNLSSELEAGTATNLTIRTADGGLTSAALASRNDDGSIDLYNAYYTACEVCEADPTPTWRIKARQVSQNPATRSVLYRDAVFELFGLPVLYTPFLAHPDPTADRASGFLAPLVGLTGDKGGFVRAPYFVAVDDYTDLTLTPRAFTGVNPLLDVELARNFRTGDVWWNSSLTYGSVFDDDGDPFRDPARFLDPASAPTGRRLRSHTFASGRFNPSDSWTWGFSVGLTSDPLYLDRYDLDRNPDTRSLYNSDSLRLLNQAYLVGQGRDWRVSASAAGFQSQRATLREIAPSAASPADVVFSAENNDTLPIIAPDIDAEYRLPLAGGELRAFGNGVYLARRTDTDFVNARTTLSGVDYGRVSAGLEWSASRIIGPGLEVSPFAFARADTFDITPNLEDAPAGQDGDASFSRALGYVGADVRYPFIRPGAVDWIVEPRVQLSHSFGDGKNERFFISDADGNPISLLQDSISIDLDPTLLWEPNKSTGFDFWQSGTRIDAGGTVAARWDNSEVSLFAGKSWADGVALEDEFDLTSGLAGASSDIVAEFDAKLGRRLRSQTRIRYDDGQNQVRRLDSNLVFRLRDLQLGARYFRVRGATPATALNPSAPNEELSGSLRWRFARNWSTSYKATYDVDTDELRRQDIGLVFDDDCTRIELIYSRNENNRILDGADEGFGIRIALATLGGTG